MPRAPSGTSLSFGLVIIACERDCFRTRRAGIVVEAVRFYAAPFRHEDTKIFAIFNITGKVAGFAAVKKNSLQFPCRVRFVSESSAQRCWL